MGETGLPRHRVIETKLLEMGERRRSKVDDDVVSMLPDVPTAQEKVEAVMAGTIEGCGEGQEVSDRRAGKVATSN